MNSRSASFPNGLANSSGALGHYLMDHTTAQGAIGVMPGHENKVVYGNRPNGTYIPRFRNLDGQDDDAEFIRGYGYQGMAMRRGWQSLVDQTPGFGEELKSALRKPGPWMMLLTGFGECLPYRENRLELDSSKTDRFGIPQVRFQFSFKENENRMRDDIVSQASTMLKTAGSVYVIPFNNNSVGGQAIHEMGTARMGDDPTKSVLNAWNQAHDIPNLFVTDGSCMTSTSCVNPSLTYMALTARAANYAANLVQSGQL